MRIVASSVNGSVTRGASRNCIERNTFPHKYIKRTVPQPPTAAADNGDEPPPQTEEDEEGDKCTICLSEFEVRLTIPSFCMNIYILSKCMLAFYLSICISFFIEN